MKVTQLISALALASTIFATSSANSATVYQSAAYGTTEAANHLYCSNCSDIAPTATIGETFTITSESMITSIDFYISSIYGSNHSIFLNFFDSSANPIFSELFTTADYIRTDLNFSVSNINAIFNSPLTLAAGTYAVFWSADDLGIPAYDGLGASQLYTDGSAPPIFTDSASALRLNGSVSNIPLPAAAWLFSSALIPLAGLGRKKLRISA